jgi:hypothetical protein
MSAASRFATFGAEPDVRARDGIERQRARALFLLSGPAKCPMPQAKTTKAAPPRHGRRDAPRAQPSQSADEYQRKQAPVPSGEAGDAAAHAEKPPQADPERPRPVRGHAR